MSQHRFVTNHGTRPVSILLGWDRPIGHYFMVIEYLDPPSSGDFSSTTNGSKKPGAAEEIEEDDEYLLYSNLNEPQPFNLSLSYFHSKLAELGLWIPEQMFQQVAADRDHRIGNRTVWYRPDGSFRDL